MTLIDEVLSFSREYINSRKERTSIRKRKISVVYKELTGENIRTSCATCYIEALFKIIKISIPEVETKKTNKMAQCNYSLRAGVLLQAFGDTSKTCTNDNITDELAEWHLRSNPGVAKYFSRMPTNAPAPVVHAATAPSAPPVAMRIIPPGIIDTKAKVIEELAAAEVEVAKLQETKGEVLQEKKKESVKKSYPSRKNKG